MATLIRLCSPHKFRAACVECTTGSFAWQRHRAMFDAQRAAAALLCAAALVGCAVPDPSRGEVGRYKLALPEADMPTLAVRELFNDRLAIMADIDHPLQQRRRLGLAALVDQQWLLPAAPFAIRRQIEKAFQKLDLPPPLLRVEVVFGGPLAFDLIRGSGMLTVAGTESGGATDGFKALDISQDELDLRRKVGIVTRAGAYVSPLSERMISLLEAAGHAHVGSSP